jgi:exonuclease III
MVSTKSWKIPKGYSEVLDRWRIDHTMVKRNRTNNDLQKIEQQDSHKKPGWSHVLRKGAQFLLQWGWTQMLRKVQPFLLYQLHP